MTKKFIPFLIIAVVLQASMAFAECDGFYLAGRVGQAKYKLEDSRSVNNYSDYGIDKKRLLLSGALGYRYEHFRAELEYIWRKKTTKQLAGVTNSRFKSPSYMFVVYYDFFPYSWFTPFVNAGAGYTQNRLQLSNSSVGFTQKVKGDSFTWSLGAGISAKVTNRVNVDLGYRYYNMGDKLSKFNGKTDLEDQEIYLGLRYVL